jgi:deazaflavin-dependent oxidoreductase (nitroreductase family)
MTQTLHPPRGINLLNAIAKPLLAAGLPMGPNGLVTVPGRNTGLPRTTPLAIIEVDGRRWVWSPWGEVQWVRNVRAARRALVEVRRETVAVTAIEVTSDERAAFFRDVLRPTAQGMRGGMWFIRTFDGVDLNDPVKAAEGRVAFELVASVANAPG